MIPKILALALFLLTAGAYAQSGEVVLLLKPAQEGGALQEAFNRLRGELSLHGFSVEVAEVSEPLQMGMLESRADEVGAVASVWFAPSEGGAVGELSRVDVWIGDRVSGTTVKRTILPGEGDQGPSVLALRALELLRSSLRAYTAEQPDRAVEGAHPERAKKAVRALKSEPEPETRIFLSAAAVVSWSLPDVSTSLGPGFGLGVVHRAVGMRLVARGPLLGGRAGQGTAAFDAMVLQLLAEPMVFPLRTRALQLGVFASLGAALLQVSGEADLPYSGRTDSTWLASLGGGADVALRMTRSLHWIIGAQAAWLLPRPVVNLANSHKKLGSPQLGANVGLRLFF